MIRFDRNICNDFDAASGREWLETNGIGGFASGTISGANTRRYHGLLTAATRPPLGRITVVSKLEDTVIIDGERHELSANIFPGSIHPKGYLNLAGFTLEPFPVWTYTIGKTTIERSVFMPHGKNSTVVIWRVIAGDAKIGLEVRPLVSFADYHQLRSEDPALDESFTTSPDSVSYKPFSDLPELNVAFTNASVDATGYWYRNFEYPIEKERGFDFHEDLYQPFVIKFEPGDHFAVIVSTEAADARSAERLEESERERRSGLLQLADAKDDLTKQLVHAADQFIVKRGSGHSIIAGYPWFSDWGRDTMIALPGLTLATNRPEIAREIILEFAKHISQGMIPNRFPDADEEPEYNTVDATLWYFEAIRAYAEETGDYDVIQEELYKKLADIIAWHLRGTRFNIRVDTDGLLYAGEAGHQLTWMDAKVGDHVITPRIGKPVEIQALWYNALRTMSHLAERFGHDEDRERFDAMADLAKLSFNGLFWNKNARCLYDVVEHGNFDDSIRPNQVLAISLAHPVLDKSRWKDVLEKVTAELLTPVGLRSLSRQDPKYVPVYIGSPLDRDSAYHQGTVWGWLIGSYIEAYRKTYDNDPDDVDSLLRGLRNTLLEAGVGQISEIFDADPPHSPRGCPAQAWSVAEVLRVLSAIGGRSRRASP